MPIEQPIDQARKAPIGVSPLSFEKSLLRPKIATIRRIRWSDSIRLPIIEGDFSQYIIKHFSGAVDLPASIDFL
jgi:hypothetical protein